MLRRGLMRGAAAAAGLGEFTAGYAETLMPDSGTAWVIAHNLGIVPKVVIVEMVGTPTATNYAIREIIVEGVSDLPADATGYIAYEYHYNGNDAQSARITAAAYYEADSMTVTLKPPFNSVRSSWDTGALYRVQVYG